MASLASLQGNGGGRIPMGSFSFDISRQQLVAIIASMPTETCRALYLAARQGDTTTAQRLLREATETYFATTPAAPAVIPVVRLLQGQLDEQLSRPPRSAGGDACGPTPHYQPPDAHAGRLPPLSFYRSEPPNRCRFPHSDRDHCCPKEGGCIGELPSCTRSQTDVSRRHERVRLPASPPEWCNRRPELRRHSASLTPELRAAFEQERAERQGELDTYVKQNSSNS